MVNMSPGTSKWLVGGLLASLAVNVFLVGLAVGRYANTARPRPVSEAAAPATPGQPSGQAALLTGPVQRLVQAIPAGQRAELVRAIEARRPALQAANQGVREARARLGETTVAEPFNRAAFLAASDQFAVRTQAQRRIFVEAIADGIAGLPVELRRSIVDSERTAATPVRRRPQQ
jgi:hypothetical protein